MRVRTPFIDKWDNSHKVPRLEESRIHLEHFAGGGALATVNYRVLLAGHVR